MVWTPLGWGGLTVNNRFTRACGQAIISVWLKQTRIEMKRIQQAKETTFRNRICKGTFRASTPVHICTYANELPLQYLRNDGILTAIIATLPDDRNNKRHGNKRTTREKIKTKTKT